MVDTIQALKLLGQVHIFDSKGHPQRLQLCLNCLQLGSYTVQVSIFACLADVDHLVLLSLGKQVLDPLVVAEIVVD